MSTVSRACCTRMRYSTEGMARFSGVLLKGRVLTTSDGLDPISSGTYWNGWNIWQMK